MIGKRIKDLRTRKGVTQDVMAKVLGVSSQAISKWEQSTTTPDISMLVPIADYFGVSVAYLLRQPKSGSAVDPARFVEITSKKERNCWRCTVKNISDRELAEVKLKTYFYDKDGNSIDYRDNLVFDLEPNMVKPELLYTSEGTKVSLIKIIVKSIKFADEQL